MITFIELFAGIGGFRRGLEATGLYECVYASDIDAKCKETYDLNFDPPHLVVEDIYDMNIEALPRADMIVGGFPCQPFSVAGKRAGLDDERGQVIFRLLKIVETIRPAILLLENVKGLLTQDNGRAFQQICAEVTALGYNVQCYILNSSDFGLPQNRERLFICGVREFNHYITLETREPAEFTDFLDETVDNKYIYSEKSSIYPVLQSEITDPKFVYQYRRHYVRKNKGGVVPTLTANMGTGGHNVPIVLTAQGIRKLTPTECFRVQGLDYTLPSLSDCHLYKQAGNAVSANVIMALGEGIARARADNPDPRADIPEACVSG